MRAAARPPVAAATTTLSQRHRRRRRRRRIFLDPTKPLAVRARHVRVAVQGNPGELVQVRSRRPEFSPVVPKVVDVGGGRQIPKYTATTTLLSTLTFKKPLDFVITVIL